MASIITIPSGAIVHDIDLDFKQDNINNKVKVKQFDKDTVYIRATIYNDGVLYPITSSKTITFCGTKKDNTGVSNTAGIDSEGRIIYKVTGATTAVDGGFDVEFRIYESTDLKGTPSFRMIVEKSSLQDGTVISTSEFNILDQLIAEANTALNQISNIASAEATRVSNENTRKSNETARVNTESARVTAENTRVSNENTRKSSETGRVNAENSRASAESSRVTAETGRSNAENTRVSNETTRQSNETTRQNNETTRQTYYNNYRVHETYSASKQYEIGNKVVNAGSTYLAIARPPVGTAPTNTTYWLCIAAKGIDGTGSGNMHTDTYDKKGVGVDIFDYADSKATYSDKLSNATGNPITCHNADDGLAEITSIADIGNGFTITSTNGVLTESVVVPYPYPTLPIYIKSFKGITTITTDADPKPSLTVNFKSELWSRDYLQDIATEYIRTNLTDTRYLLDTLQRGDTYTGLNLNDIQGFKSVSGYEMINAPDSGAYAIINVPYHASVFYDYGFQIAVNVTDITKSPLYRVKVNYVWSGWKKYLTANDVVNNDTTGGTNKVASAEVVKVLGQEVDVINTTTYSSASNTSVVTSGFIKTIKSHKTVTLAIDIHFTISATTTTEIATISSEYAPTTRMPMVVLPFLVNVPVLIYVEVDGKVYAYCNTAGTYNVRHTVTYVIA